MNAKQIDNALVSHALWRARLTAALAIGRLDMSLAQIQADNECDFGKWLYSPLLAFQEKQSEHYRTVKELHAEFHRTAGRIATLAIEGKRAEAEHMMTSGG
ncbi:CZB domain-containing protein [Geomonas sp. RF6]|uniref:CZB domain-containing protein n=1 Tax=Geomonas sp. RF6 TaxID=2897342 RepID=UPI001E443696|nr:CZB domain-containing protein [Geomonas sp. RF6]UFS72670.1 CZB domain-containing protein [Geomonas sp. RF6]